MWRLLVLDGPVTVLVQILAKLGLADVGPQDARVPAKGELLETLGEQVIGRGGGNRSLVQDNPYGPLDGRSRE